MHKIRSLLRGGFCVIRFGYQIRLYPQSYNVVQYAIIILVKFMAGFFSFTNRRACSIYLITKRTYGFGGN